MGKREFEPDMFTVEYGVTKLKLLRETCINQRAVEGEGNFTTGYYDNMFYGLEIVLGEVIEALQVIPENEPATQLAA
jgi:hypothetical protein